MCMLPQLRPIARGQFSQLASLCGCHRFLDQFQVLYGHRRDPFALFLQRSNRCLEGSLFRRIQPASHHAGKVLLRLR